MSTGPHRQSPPRVSIGIPVYNGENFLAEAIRSILAQTFEDLELVISDNASTDRTEAICREFAGTDRRIRYHRNEVNIGLGPNFNRVFELANGTYFKWACHDDLIEPTYLEKCIAVLDADPELVLCHAMTRVIGEQQGLIEELQGVDAERPSERFAAVTLRPHWCMDIHAVIRAEALRRAAPMAGYFGADKAVLARLALLGRWARVPEPLFINRDHPARTMRAISFADRLRFNSPDRTGPRTLPTWELYGEYRVAAQQLVSDPAERRRCRRHLARWWFTNWHWARVALDVVAAVAPRASGLAFRARQWYHRGPIGVRQS